MKAKLRLWACWLGYHLNKLGPRGPLGWIGMRLMWPQTLHNLREKGWFDPLP